MPCLIRLGIVIFVTCRAKKKKQAAGQSSRISIVSTERRRLGN